MAQISSKLEVYLEIGKKRTFAGVIAWPGWCQSTGDEHSALQALFDYRARYERVLYTTNLGFHAPTEVAVFTVIEKLEGNTTTDFGAPDIAPTKDKLPVDEIELLRFQTLLEACWQALDETVRNANGKELRKGPRGGGRDLEAIFQHVLEAERAYLGRLGWHLKKSEESDPGKALSQTRDVILEALRAAAHGQIPAQGPRGGMRWTPRYFVRRATWHVLDHVWEIEDCLTPY